MKRTIFYSLLVLLLCCVVNRAQAHDDDGPKMVFERMAHDFGDIERKGGDVITMFRFVNEGDTPLIIKKIHKSCSCTTANYSRRPVLPGESGEIKIKYEPHKVEPGKFHRVIQIYTNESSKVKLITIQGNSVDKKKKR
jgi:hypothetical protein